MANASNTVYIELPGGGKFEEIYITSAEDCHTMDVLGTPGEDGIVKFDNRVCRPATVHVEGWVSRDGYANISAMADAQTAENLSEATCRFYNRDGSVVENLVPKSVRVRSTADHLNMIYVVLDLQEFLKAE